MSKTQTKLLLDATLFALFVTVVLLGFRSASRSGGAFCANHEWLGLLMATLVIGHLALQARWIAATTKAVFRELPRRTRVCYGIDLVLLLLFAAILLSGLMISGVLGNHVTASPGWIAAHHAATKLAALVVTAHVALHWRWLADKLRRSLA